MLATVRILVSQFVQGASRPSPLALATMALSCLLTLFVGMPSLTASPWSPVLATSHYDYYLTATNVLMNLTAPPARPMVVLLGPSGLRQALVEDQSFNDLIEPDRTQQPYLLNLTTGGARSWDMVALADRLPVGFTGVVVFGVGPSTLSYRDEVLAEVLREPRLGITSNAVDDEAREHGLAVPFRCGISFADNWRFYAARAEALLNNVVYEFSDQQRVQPKQPLAEHRRSYVARYGDQVRNDYPSASGPSLGRLGRIIESLRRRDRVRVVLVETPIAWPLIRDGLGVELYQQHLLQLHRFAADTGVRFIDFNKDAKLLAVDMLDYVHISSSTARQKCSALLAETVRGELTQLEANEAAKEDAGV